MTDRALVVRCPGCGQKLIEVIWENGKPIALAREESHKLQRNQSGDLVRTLVRRTETRWDLTAEAPDLTVITVRCGCGGRIESLAELHEALRNGATGKRLSSAPLMD